MSDWTSDRFFVRFVFRDEYEALHDNFLLCSYKVDSPSARRSVSDNQYSAERTVLLSDREFLDCKRFSCKNINDFVKSLDKYASKGIRLDGYSCSLFKYIVETSSVYRDLVADFFMKSFGGGAPLLKVRVRLLSPEHHLLDRKWNDMIWVSCQERRELETAMSWLSTLGGAFSSLGDDMVHCAVAAGRISAHQLNLALRLGDPMTVIRCKLYLAISLIQTRRFRLAASIIKSQYTYVHTFKAMDRRIVAMCQGIWAKLKYEKSLYKSRTV